MTFGRALGNSRAGAGAVGVILASSALVLFFNLILGLGILPASGRREREIPLELTAVSEGTTPLSLSAHEVVVHVAASGEVRVGGAVVTMDALGLRLAELVAGAQEDQASQGGSHRTWSETALTVRADARAPYGLVARILAAGRRAGIRSCALVTVEPPAAQK